MNSRLIAESGILTSLSLVILLIASVSPVNKVFIASASALVLEVFIKRNSIKQSIFVFFPTAILGLIFLPYKMIAVLYLFLFGGFSLIRNLIVHKNVLLKKFVMVMYFDVVFCMLFLIANQLFENLFAEILIGPFWQNMLLFFVLQVVVLLYDYALDLGAKIIVAKLKDIGV
jgi:hypothetical protein